LGGRFDLVTSQTQLDELQRALDSPKLRDRINSAQVQDFVINIDVMAIVVPSVAAVSVSPDPDDHLILATAIAGEADLIVSLGTVPTAPSAPCGSWSAGHIDLHKTNCKFRASLYEQTGVSQNIFFKPFNLEDTPMSIRIQLRQASVKALQSRLQQAYQKDDVRAGQVGGDFESRQASKRHDPV
jgi:hypothetical protein